MRKFMLVAGLAVLLANPSISPKRKTKISDLGLLKSKKSKMELFTKVRFLRKIRGVGNGK